MFEVRIDASAFVAWCSRAQDEFPAGARQVAGQAVGRALLNAQQTTSFRDRTGELRFGGGRPRLRRSLQRGQTGPWDFFIRATAPHALFVEKPTKPHRIPKTGSANPPLRFVQYGRVRFARFVNHPGTKGTHFLSNAGIVGRDALEDGFDRLVDRIFR
jgi:hypothetical protein